MANPRTDRLNSDYNKLQALVARSDFVKILGTKGTPANEYTIQFTCRGIKSLNGGQPVYSEDHRVRVKLGSQYPLSKPDLRWLTPIYHPNISGSGSVCIGNEWASGGRYLDDLVIYLAQMVRYEGEDMTFSSDAFNREAYAWAKRNKQLLPVDKRPLLRPEWEIQILAKQTLDIQVNEVASWDIQVTRTS
ncbi:MAG TPA: hypothetical protein EYH05_18000 [Anaerolineae bacterium]|nr:hypothetical protein [Anaerolineae bacterium]